MKRLCFDTESDVHNDNIGVHDHEFMREWLDEYCRTAERRRVRRRNPPPAIRFDCAVVYDEHENKFEEYKAAELPALVAKLATADVLISQNGKRWDMLILEKVCGEKAIEPLKSIDRIDLMDLTNWQSLDDLGPKCIPDRLPGMQLAYDERITDADRCDDFIGRKLARARFDVERTFAIFGVLEKKKSQKQ